MNLRPTLRLAVLSCLLIAWVPMGALIERGRLAADEPSHDLAVTPADPAQEAIKSLLDLAWSGDPNGHAALEQIDLLAQRIGPSAAAVTAEEREQVAVWEVIA